MNLKNIKARDIMVEKLITITPDTKIALADLTMTRGNIGGLPVVEKGKLVGIITQRDIMFARSYEVGGLTAEDLMTKDIATVGPEASLKEVLNLMINRKIERVPVVKGGKLVGLIVHNRILKTVHDNL